jgi:hypothetical protein
VEAHRTIETWILPHFLDNRFRVGGEDVILARRPALYPQEDPGYSFTAHKCKLSSSVLRKIYTTSKTFLCINSIYILRHVLVLFSLYTFRFALHIVNLFHWTDPEEAKSDLCDLTEAHSTFVSMKTCAKQFWITNALTDESADTLYRYAFISRSLRKSEYRQLFGNHIRNICFNILPISSPLTKKKKKL